MLYSQLNRPKRQSEDVSGKDLPILDTESITSVVGFMQKFQQDATFAPPTLDVLYDTDKFDVGIDDESFGLYDELESFEFDENTREKSNNVRDKKETKME